MSNTNPTSNETLREQLIGSFKQFLDTEPGHFTYTTCYTAADEFIRRFNTESHAREQAALHHKLQSIADNHYDPDLKTYDYDGIAEDVLTIIREEQ